ncbi:hypothetical protein MVES_001885 [Malassezia vespertilionis]|uniref:Bim1p n=1 Tax=Malassezia vespertilionis TaxID=2020962 RepID=A0A2N1JBA4_9BASI|nr:hypothetical protein MVES_001885 [Malassezia vespertilionis]
MSASRTELIGWINDLLDLNYTKVEQCGTGAAYAQVIDSIYGNVPMSRINYAARHDYESMGNYKILQNVFQRNRIDKPIPVDRLVRCKMQDNLEFLQWLKKYWDINYAGDGYDAEARRAGHPGTSASAASVRRVGSSAAQSRPSVAPRPSVGPRASVAPRQSVGPRASVAQRPPAAPRQSVAPGAARRMSVAGRGVPMRGHAAALSNETINQLTAEIDEMKISVDSLERERDFYFGKLRDVEVIVQDRLTELEKSTEGKDEQDAAEHGLLKQIQAVLYQTEEGFELPDAAGEVRLTTILTPQPEPLDETETF